MKSHFIERMITKTMGKETSILIRPAITPDVLPETFHLPEQQFIPFPLTPSVPSNLKPSEVTPQEEAARPKQIPIPKDSTPTGTVSDAIPPEDTAPLKISVDTRNAKAKDIEQKESKEPTLTESKESKRGPTTEKIEKEITPIQSTIKSTELKESTQTPAEKDFSVSEREVQTHPTEEKPEHKASILNVVRISDEVNKFASKKLMPSEKVYKLIPQSEDLQGSKSEVVVPTKPVEQTQPKLPLVRPKTYSSMLEKESPERSQGYSEPTVTINIGRIEVRAIMPQKPSNKTRMPALSLKDYLKQRSEERR